MMSNSNMDTQVECSEISVEEKILSQHWKLRVEAYETLYEEVTSLADDASSELCDKYLDYVNSCIEEKHPAVQDKALELLLAIVQKCEKARALADQIMEFIVQQCLGNVKSQTKKLAMDISIALIQQNKADVVIEALKQGMSQKKPKTVVSCLNICITALQEFGNNIVPTQPLLEKLPEILVQRDQAIRDAGKELALQMYLWIGDAIKPYIKDLTAILKNELEAEMLQIQNKKPEPKRTIKAEPTVQKAKIEQKPSMQLNIVENLTNIATSCDKSESTDDVIVVCSSDEEICSPANLKSLLTKDFYEKLENSKWQIRKESLDDLDRFLTQYPRANADDYSTLVNTLAKLLAKECNKALLELAARCVGKLAKALGKNFAPYAEITALEIMANFKEKKPAMLDILRDAMDAILKSSDLDRMADIIIYAMRNKTPGVRSETVAFLARELARTKTNKIKEDTVKKLAITLKNTLIDADRTVRDGSAEALARLQMLTSVETISVHLKGVEALRIAKVTELFEQFQSTNASKRVAGGSVEKTPNEAVKITPVQSNYSKAHTARAKTPQPKKSCENIVKPTKCLTARGPAPGKDFPKLKSSLPTETVLCESAIMNRASDLLLSKNTVDLSDVKWSIRLTAIGNIIERLPTLDGNTPGFSQIILRFMTSGKYGLKDTNQQVALQKLELMLNVIDKYYVTSTTIEWIIPDVVERFSDTKCGYLAEKILTLCAEKMNFMFVASRAYRCAFDQRNARVQAESINWLSNALIQFGFPISRALVTEYAMQGLASITPMVRNAATKLVGTACMHFGRKILEDFDRLKPILRVQIETECMRRSKEKLPEPTKGPKAVRDDVTVPFATTITPTTMTPTTMTPTTEKTAATSTAAATPTTVTAVAGNIPTNNAQIAENERILAGQEHSVLKTKNSTAAVSSPTGKPLKITQEQADNFFRMLDKKEWKSRMYAIGQLQTLLEKSNDIQPALLRLSQLLEVCVKDVNVQVRKVALDMCRTLAETRGRNCKGLLRYILKDLLNSLGDSRLTLRKAAAACLKAFAENVSYREFFEAKIVTKSLAQGSCFYKLEIWTLLADLLPKLPPKTLTKDELMCWIQPLYSNLSDRDNALRKASYSIIHPMIQRLGYDRMEKEINKQKPAMRRVISEALEKASLNTGKPNPNAAAEMLKQCDSNTLVRSKSLNAISQAAAPERQAGGDIAGITRSKTFTKDTKIDINMQDESKYFEEFSAEDYPLFVYNNKKNERFAVDNLKPPKWNTMTKPRQDHFKCLRKQMLEAEISRKLVTFLFDSDTTIQTYGIETLNSRLYDEIEEIKSSLDLVLKWIALGFHSNSEDVLLETLELSKNLMKMLAEEQYVLLDEEANSFLPHLIHLLGHSDENVRNMAKESLEEIKHIYDAAKILAKLLDSLNSPMQRLREELMKEMLPIIRFNELNVWRPLARKSIEIIKGQLSDIASSNVKAALNCLAEIYIKIDNPKRFKSILGPLKKCEDVMLQECIKQRVRRTRESSDKEAQEALCAKSMPRPQTSSTRSPLVTPVVNNVKPNVPQIPQSLSADESSICATSLPGHGHNLRPKLNRAGTFVTMPTVDRSCFIVTSTDSDDSVGSSKQ